MKPKFFLAKSIATLVATTITLTSALHALPQGEQVQAGSAAFSRTGAALDIRTSDRAIINYQSFSIGAAERVNFIQPSVQSITLNRVTAPNPSQIFGTLTSNGQIVLANPYGIYFQSGSVVNVGGLVAAAGHISNSDFLAGRINFSSLSGDVENHGSITAVTDVGLYGEHVTNTGTITSQNGSVTLAAGSSVYVGEAGGNIFVGSAAAIPKARVVSKPGISNTGRITASKATLVAGDMYGIAIAQSGDIISGDITIAAGAGGSVDVSARLDASNRTAGKTGGKIKVKGDTVTVRGTSTLDASGSAGGGTILLEGGHNPTMPTTVTSSGKLLARGEGTGAKGGTVQMTGDHVGLLGNAVVDVSGDAGGGTALIGGDYQGKNPNIQNAQRTYISLGAQIYADALTIGNGGKVIVWADDVTRYYGSISARGGAQSGNGGFVEVSGKRLLDFAGAVNAGASNGRTGTLLLDPQNITVDSAGANGNLVGGAGTTDGDPNKYAFSEDPAATSNVRPAFLDGLNATVTLQASQDITFTSAVNLTTLGSGLIAQAGRSILINNNITTNNGLVSLTANETVANGVVDSQRGPLAAVITMAAGTTINAGNANVSLIISTGPTTNFTSGSITLANLTTTGHVLVANNGPTAGSGIVRADATQLITASSAALNVGGAGGAGAIGTLASPIRVSVTNVEARSQSAGAFIDSTTLGVTLGGANLGGLTGISTVAGGDIRITSAGTVTITENIAAGAGKVDIVTTAGDINGGGGTISTTNAVTGVTLNAAGGIGVGGVVNTSLGGTGVLNLSTGGAAALGNITLVEAGALNTSNVTLATAASAQTVSLTSTAGPITLGAAIGNATDNLTLIATAGNIVGGAGTATANNLTLNAAGGIGIGTAVNTNTVGNLSLTSGGAGVLGNITLVEANALNTTRITTLATAASVQTVSLTSTAGLITLGANIGNATDNLTLIATAGDIVGGAATTATANDLTLNAVAGGIGIGTTVNTNTAGTLSLATGGAGALGNITVVEANALNLNVVTTDVATAQTVNLTSGLGITISGAVGSAAAPRDSFVLTATTGNIIGGGGTVTANNLTLNAVAGGIGIGTALSTDTLGNLSLTTGGAGALGNITLVEANALNTTRITALATAASAQTVSLTSTAGPITLGAAIGNATDNLTLITSAGNIVGGAGAAAANNLILNAAGGIGIGTAVNTSVAGTVSLTTGGAAAAGNITLVDAGLLNLNTVTTSGATTQTVDLTGATGVRISGAVGNAGATRDNFVVTATTGNIVGNGGTLLGGNLTLAATAGGIGIGTAVNTNSTGTVNLSTGGAAALGNITLVEAGALNTSNVTLATAASAQTVSLTSTAGPITLGAAIGNATDNLTLIATAGNIVGGAGTATANNLTLNAAGGIGIGTAVNTNTVGNLSLTSGGAGVLGNITLVEANALNTTRITTLATAASVQTVSLTSTAGLITLGANIGNATDNLTLIATAGDIVGGAATTATANDLTLNAVAGGIGIGTTVNTNTAGTLSLTTGGAGALGNITVVEANALNLNVVTTDVATAQTVNLTSGLGITISGAVGSAAAPRDSFVLTATTGNIIGGGGTVTANNLTLNAVAGGIGIGTALSTDTLGNLSLTTGGAGALGNITLVEANALNTTRITTLATAASAQTVSLTSTAGPITLGAAIGNATDSLTLITSAGNIVGGAGAATANNLILNAAGGIGIGTAVNSSVAGTVSLTTGGAAAAGNITLVDAGLLNLNTVTTAGATTQTVDLTGATGVRISGAVGNAGATRDNFVVTATTGNIVGNGGTLLGGNLTLAATAGGIGIGTAVNTNSTGTVNLTTGGAAALGNITLVEAGALNLNTVTTDGATTQAVNLTGATGVTITGAVGNAGATRDNFLVTATTGNIVGNGGTVTANDLTLVATAGGIGIGTAVNTNTLGNLSLTTGGAAAAGNITLVEANALNTNRITVLATAASVQTVSLTSTAGPITLGAAIGNATDNLTLITSAGDIVGGAGTATANNLTMNAAGGIGIGTAVNTNTAGTLNLTTAGAAAAGNITVLEAGLLNLTGVTTNGATTQTVNLTGATGVQISGAVGTAGPPRDNFLLTATTGNIVNNGGTVTANDLTLSAAAGGIGTNPVRIATAASGILTLIAGTGGAFVDNTGSVTLAAPVLGAGASITVTSTGSLTLPAVALTLTGAGAMDFRSNGGTLATNGALTTATGSITLAGSAGITLGHDLTTGGGFILLTGNTTLAGNRILTSAGGTITAAGSVAGAGNNLTVNAGAAGDVGFNGAVDNVALLTITNSNNTTFANALGAGTPGAVTITNSTGTVAFQGDTRITTLTTFAQPYNVSFTGSTNTIAGATTFLNTGTLTLGNGGGDTIAFTGGVVATAQTGVTNGIVLNGTVSAAGAGAITLGDADTGVNVTGDSVVGGTSTGLITMGNVLLNNGVTLTVGASAATPINLAAVSGTLGGTASNLTFDTLGVVTVAGAVGTDIGTLTITNSGGTTFQGTVDAATIAITNTTAAQTVAFQGNTNATTGMTVGAGGYNVSFTGGNNTIAGATTFNNTGTLTLGDGVGGDTITFTGGVVATAPSLKTINGIVSAAGVGVINLGTTAVNVAGNSTVGGTSTGLITLGNATLVDNVTLILGDGAATPITAASISGTAGGLASNVTFFTLGAVTVAGAVGTDIGALTITNSGGATFQSTVDVGTIAITSTVTAQTVAFQDNTNATIGMTVGAGGYNVSFTGGNNTIAGATTFNNTGTLTLGDAATDVILFSGGVTATAPSVTLNGQVRTSAAAILLGSATTPVTLAGATSVLDTTNTGLSIAGNNITLDGAVTGTVAGVQDLTLTAGTGTINFNRTVGVPTRLGAVLINSAANVNLNDTFVAASLVQTAGTGTTTIGAAGTGVNTNTVTGVNLAANTIAVNNAITTTGGGIVTLNATTGALTIAAAGIINADGAVTLTAVGGISTAGNVTTTNDNITFNSATTLTGGGTVALNTGAGIGNILFGSTLTGTTGGAENLTLTAGTGDITFANTVGAPTRLGAVLINSAANVNVNNTFTAASLVQLAGNGTTTIGVAGAGVNTNTATGVNLAANTIAVNNAITTTGAGIVTLNATTGALTIAAAGIINADGAVTLTAAGGISTAGNVTTTNDDITFVSPTTLTGSVALNTGAGIGNILFSSTLTGTTGGAENLTLTAGTGDITFTNTVGAPTRLGAVLINSAANVNVNNTFTATSLVQLAGTGTTTIGAAGAGVNTNTGTGVNLAANTIAVNNAITTTGGGIVTLNATTGALTIAAAGDIFADGAVDLTGAGGINTSGDVTTTNDNITFNSATTLTGGGTVALNTGAGIGNILFGSTLTGTTGGAENLTLTAGTGDITFANTVGAPTRLGAVLINSAANVNVNNTFTAASLVQLAGTGTTTIGVAGAGVNTNTATGVNLAANTIAVNNAITTTGAGIVTLNATTGALTIAAAGIINADGAVTLTAAGGISTAGNVTTTNDDITFVSPTTLTGSVALNTGAGIGNILFGSTLTGTTGGAENLTLTAGTGDITFANTVGAPTRLGAVLINSAANVNVNNTFTAASLVQLAGTGTTTIGVAGAGVNTNTATGVNLAANTIAVNNAITTTGAGIVTLNATTGALTIAAAGIINADGAVTLTAAGGISTAGNVTTTNDDITFVSPTTLTGSVALNTGAGIGNILFSSTLTGTTGGAENLTLTAGTGDITFANTVGAPTRLGGVLINSAANVNLNNTFVAASLVQTAGTGTTTIGVAGAGVNTNTGTGVNLAANTIAVNNAITTTGGGIVTLNATTGALTIAAAGDIFANNTVNMTATLGISTAGDVTVNANAAPVNYNSATVLSGSVAIDTTAGGATGSQMRFFSTLDGNNGLTITNGTTGDVVFSGLVGNTVPVGAILINSANNVTGNGVRAASFVQTTGQGTATLNGGLFTVGGTEALDTTRATGVSVTTRTIALNEKLTTSGTGPVSLLATANGGGTLTILAAGDILANNTVNLTATGGINTAGDVTGNAAGAPVNFNSAVTLTGNVVVLSTGSGNITFNSTVNGLFALEVNTGGDEIFNGRVGDLAPLASLTTDATNLGGNVIFNAAGTLLAPSVSTTGGQTYNDGVRLGADVVMQSLVNGTIQFNSTVDSFDATPRALTVNTGGVTGFGDGAGDDRVGAVNALRSLTTDDDAVAVNGPLGERTVFNVDPTVPGFANTVLTTETQTYNEAVVLMRDTVVRTTGAAALGNILFTSTVDSNSIATPSALTVNTGGDTLFGNGGADYVGGNAQLLSLTTDAGGQTILNIVPSSLPNQLSVTTRTTQIFGDNVVLRQATQLNGTTLTFAGTVTSEVGVNNLTIRANPGDLNVQSTLSANSIILGAADVRFVGAVSGVNTLDIQARFVGGGSGLGLLPGSDAPVPVALGVCIILGNNVTTIGGQTYLDCVKLTNDVILASTNNGNIQFNSTVDSDLTARALTVNTGGVTGFGDSVGDDRVGLMSALLSLTTDAVGSTVFNVDPTVPGFANTVRTSGTQTYNDAVTLTQDTVLTSAGAGAAGNIAFNSTVDTTAGASPDRALTVNTAGGTLFGDGGADNVGLTKALASLTTDAPGSTVFNILGGAQSVRTSGTQTYNDAVTLTQDTVLTSTGTGAAGNIVFNSTVDTTAGASPDRALTVNTAGGTLFGDGGADNVGLTKALASVTTDAPGSTVFNILGGAQSVRTSGTQTYNDAVTLTQDTVLTSTGTGAAGNIVFNSTVDTTAGASPDRALTVNTAGGTLFGDGGADNVGLTKALASVTTDAPGSTVFNILGGAQSVRTSGTQTYNDAVTLTQDTVLTSTGTGAAGNIVFNSTVDTTAGASPDRALTVNTAGGTLFGDGGADNVGLTKALASLTTDAPGSTVFNILGGAQSVRTSGTQTYNDAVTLTQDTVLTSTGAGAAGNIVFNSTVDTTAGASPDRALTVNTAGDTLFGDGGADNVGLTRALASLTTDAPGTTVFNILGGAQSVRTSGTQTYNDAVTLAKDTLLRSTGLGAAGTITFQKTVDSDAALTPRDLAINTAGDEVFNGRLGGIFKLGSLSIDGDVAVGAGVGKTIFNFAGTTLLPTVSTVNNGVKTGAQTYNDGVELRKDTVLASSFQNAGTSGGNITFQRTVDSDGSDLAPTPRALEVNTSGSEVFNNLVGDGQKLKSLMTDADVGPGLGIGNTVLNVFRPDGSATVRTTSGQVYNDEVTLRRDTLLQSTGGGDIKLLRRVDAALVTSLLQTQNNSLQIVTSGNATLGASISNITALFPQVSGTTTIGTAPNPLIPNDPGPLTQISVSRSLRFIGPVVIQGRVELTTSGDGQTAATSGSFPTGSLEGLNSGASMTFDKTVDGPGALSVNSGGVLTFDGAVGFGLTGVLDSLTATAPVIQLQSTKTNKFLSADAKVATASDGSDGLLRLSGNFYSSSSGGVYFNSSNRATVSNHATILSTAGDLTISAAGEFKMGSQQKLLVNNGSLTITAGSAATIGDLAALTSLKLTASAVFLQGRPLSGNINQNRKDKGLGFVSPTISFNTSSMAFLSGTNQKAVLSTKDSIASAPGTAGVSLELDKDLLNQFGQQDVLGQASIGIMQPIASGTLVTEPSKIQVVFVLDIPKLVELPETTFLSRADQDVLAKMGIYPREATSDENITVSLRRGVFRQPIEGKAQMDDPEYKVVVNRLTTAEVKAIVDVYTELAGKDFENLKKIATVLAEQVNKFQTATPGALGLEGFTKWLQAQRASDKSAEELSKNLDELASVFVRLARIGLTKKEVMICKLKICDELKEFLPNVDVWDVVPLVEGGANPPPQAPRPAMTAPPADVPPPAATPPADGTPAPLPPAPLPPPPEAAGPAPADAAASPPAAPVQPAPDVTSPPKAQ